MYSKVIKYIQSRILINTEDLEKSFKYCEPKIFLKGEKILSIGQYCHFVGFLNQGLIITTIRNPQGIEKASGFIHEGCFFTYTEGLASDTPSHKNFIALENCDTIMLTKANLAKNFKDNPKFETLMNQILAEEVKSLLLNEQALKTLTLDERYKNLNVQFPSIFQRVPLKYIADYLGVEPQSLSRFRKRLSAK